MGLYISQINTRENNLNINACASNIQVLFIHLQRPKQN